MLRTDIGKLLVEKKEKSKMTWTEIAEQCGVRPQAVNKLMHKQISGNIVQAFEVLGYDIKIMAVRRKDK